MVISSLLRSATSTPGLVDQVRLLMLLLIVTLIVALVAQRVRLPYTLLLVLVGLIIGVSPILPDVHLDPNVVLYIFLPPLLFEGAWNAEMEKLQADWLPIALLAVPGLVLSMLLVAAVLYWGIGLSWLLALLVGAIISPTDPIAVIALFRQLGLPDRLRSIVEGESLFNDGIGAAAYELILAVLLPTLGLAEGLGSTSFLGIAGEVFWLIFGGLLLGFGVGWVVSRLLRWVNDHLMVTTVTFSVAYGMYVLGTALHTSGLLAVVGAGLVIGSYGRQTAMSRQTIEATDDVWEFVGYLANSLLFLLLGFELAATHLAVSFVGIFLGVLGAVLGRVLMIYTFLPLQDALARWLARRATKPRFPLPRPIPSVWRPVMVLSGLRGALSLALVLGLPTALEQRNLLTDIVYGVVLVTLLGQGLTLRVLLPQWQEKLAREPSGS